MTQLSLNPDSTIVAGGAVTGAGGDHDAALADASDSTFILYTGVTNCTVGLSSASAIPATAVVKAVLGGATCMNLAWGSNVPNLLHVFNPGGWDQSTTYAKAVSNTTFGGRFTFYREYPYTVSDLNSATLTVGNYSGGSPPAILQVSKSWVTVIYVTRPVTPDVIAPTGIVTDDTQPLILWSESMDGDGGKRTHFQVRVFTAAQYGAAGFDPEKSVSYVDSGIKAEAGTVSWLGGWDADQALPNDTYRAYVRYGQTLHGKQHWSPWGFEQFTMNVPVPNAPTLGALPNPAQARNTITITDGGGAVMTDRFEVQRVAPDGGKYTAPGDLRPAFWMPLGEDFNDVSGNGYTGTLSQTVPRTITGQPGPFPGLEDKSSDFSGYSVSPANWDAVVTNYMTRRNWVKNPSAETDMTGYSWYVGGANATIFALQRDSNWSPAGDWSLYAAATHAANSIAENVLLDYYYDPANPTYGRKGFPVTPGQYYTAAVKIKSWYGQSSGTVFASMTWWNSAGTFITQNDSALVSMSASEQWVTWSALAPANAAYCILRPLVTLGFATNGQIIGYGVDEVMFCNGNLTLTEDDYFDGSGYKSGGSWISDQGGKTGWLGTAHASASDKGCFANGTVRSFSWWHNRDVLGDSQGVIGENAGFITFQFNSVGLTVYSSVGDAAGLVGFNLLGAFAQAAGRWDHYVVVFNEPANWISLYQNGVLVEGKAFSGQWSVNTSTPTGPANGQVSTTTGMVIGSYTTASQAFDGKIAHVSVHERALSAGEVKDLYDAGAEADWEPARTIEGDGIVSVPSVIAQASTADTADTASHVVTLPLPTRGQIEEDDLLIAVAGMDGNSPLIWPDGWTAIKDDAGNGSAVRAGVAYRRCEGGETGTITVTSGGTEGGGFQVMLVRGAHPSQVPEVSTGVNSAGTNPDPDTLTPTGWANENTLWIAAMVNDGNVAVFGYPAGYFGGANPRWANASGAGAATCFRRATTNSENPIGFGMNAEDSRAFTIGVRPPRAEPLLLDYDAENGETVRYRARAHHDYTDGGVAMSPWSAVKEATWTSATWWLKHPFDPTKNVNPLLRSSPNQSRPSRQGIFQPLGSEVAVVVTDTRGAWQGELAFLLDTEEEREALAALLADGVPLLLNPPSGVDYPTRWLSFGDYNSERSHDSLYANITFDAVPFVHVAKPPGRLVAGSY